jgi:hypothetical protein
MSADSKGRRLFLHVPFAGLGFLASLPFKEASDISQTHPAVTHSPRPLNNMATLTRMALGRNMPIFIKVPGLVKI